MSRNASIGSVVSTILYATSSTTRLHGASRRIITIVGGLIAKVSVHGADQTAAANNLAGRAASRAFPVNSITRGSDRTPAATRGGRPAQPELSEFEFTASRMTRIASSFLMNQMPSTS